MSRYTALPFVAVVVLALMSLVACGGSGDSRPPIVTFGEVVSAVYTADDEAEGTAAYQLLEDFLGLENEPLYRRAQTEAPTREFFGALISESNQNPSQNPTFGEAIAAMAAEFGVEVNVNDVLAQLNAEARQAFVNPAMPFRHEMMLISVRSGPTRDETSQHIQITASATTTPVSLFILIRWFERTQTFDAPPPPPPVPAPTNPCMQGCAAQRLADYRTQRRVVKTLHVVVEIYFRFGNYASLRQRFEYETRIEATLGRITTDIERDYRDCIERCHQQG